jgi:hypothetical protein
MPERKVKINVPGMGTVEGTQVELTESVERWTELKLSDGSVIRVKPTILNITRIDGRYDAQGNPLYALQGAQTMLVSYAPDHLRQGAPNPKVQ